MRRYLPPDDEEAEFAAMVRENEGVVQQLRVEALARKLRNGWRLAVRHSTFGFTGDRLRMWLDDGTVLKLRLLWPRRTSLAALCSIEWVERLWVVVARSTSGDPVTLYSWQARIELGTI